MGLEQPLRALRWSSLLFCKGCLGLKLKRTSTLEHLNDVGVWVISYKNSKPVNTHTHNHFEDNFLFYIEKLKCQKDTKNILSWFVKEPTKAHFLLVQNVISSSLVGCGRMGLHSDQGPLVFYQAGPG